MEDSKVIRKRIADACSRVGTLPEDWSVQAQLDGIDYLVMLLDRMRRKVSSGESRVNAVADSFRDLVPVMVDGVVRHRSWEQKGPTVHEIVILEYPLDVQADVPGEE